MIVRCALAIAALATAACGPGLSDQKPPLYTLERTWAMCSSTTKVDTTGLSAHEHGCEATTSGWKMNRMTDEQRRRFFDAVGALPPPGKYGSCGERMPHDHFSFEITEPGKPTKTWTFCGGPDQEPLKRLQDALGSE